MSNYLVKDREFYHRVLLITVPIIVQKFLTSLLTLIDTYIFGFLGESALAVMSLANIPLHVVMMFLFGAQSGTSILISQFYGNRDYKSINKVIGVAFYTVSAVTLGITFILLVMPETFLSLFSNDMEIVKLSVNYTRLVSFAYFFNAISLVYLCSLNAMERTKTGTYILTSSMILKVILNRILTSLMGIDGAGLATLIARMFELSLCVFHMLKNDYFSLDYKTVLNPGTQMIKRYFSSAGTVVINETIWGMGISSITNVMSHMHNSVNVLSAFSVSQTAQNIVNSLSGGFSNATAIVVGVAVGKKEDEKSIREKGYKMIILSVLVGVIFGLAMFLFNQFLGYSFLFPLFKLSDVSAHMCYIMMIINAFLLPLRMFNNTIVVGVLRGAGDVRFAALVDILPLWIGAVPFAYVCGLILNLSIGWVYSSYIVQYLLQSFFGFYRLKSRNWIKDMTKA